MLTIYYDGNCPMCSVEMEHLKRHDQHGLITLVNLHQPNFEMLYPTIEFSNAMKVLHGEYNGTLLLGLEVTHRAWTIVGKGFWVAPLNWPLFKTVSHWIYLGIAKYRRPISYILAKTFGINSTQCNTGTCYGNTKNIDRRRK